jgi:hypothetical protein
MIKELDRTSPTSESLDLEAEREQVGDQMPSWREVFLYFLMLGFVNIGGPVAQITMMYNHMVERRQWLSDDRFVKIMAFCHMLPGPEALQLAIYVGYLKRKAIGGILAGLTFILPGRVRNDCSQLVVRRIWQSAASEQRALRFETLRCSVLSEQASSSLVERPFETSFLRCSSSRHLLECALRVSTSF